MDLVFFPFINSVKHILSIFETNTKGIIPAGEEGKHPKNKLWHFYLVCNLQKLILLIWT